MLKKSNLLFCSILFTISQFVYAQTVELSGTISGDEDVENIHILNKTSLTNATSNKEGAFVIKAKVNDTIIFSSVQYELLVRVVNKQDLLNKNLNVTLQLFTNQLDEVFLVKPLTGKLDDDILNSDAKPDINFYDVGIPGYKGKQKTPAQKRLFEATSGGGFIPLNPIINAITGRTKKLKDIIKLENNDALLARLKNDLKEDFFRINPLDKKHHIDFFYFVQEDPDFRSTCTKSNLHALAFFKKKLDQYNSNLSEKE